VGSVAMIESIVKQSDEQFGFLQLKAKDSQQNAWNGLHLGVSLYHICIRPSAHFSRQSTPHSWEEKPSYLP
jgi:hypothetical protein